MGAAKSWVPHLPPCPHASVPTLRCRARCLLSLQTGGAQGAQLGPAGASLEPQPLSLSMPGSLQPSPPDPREWPVLQRSPGATPQLKFGSCLQQPPRTELSPPPLSAHPPALPNAAFSIPRLARTEWGPRGPRSEDWAGPGGLGWGQWPQPGGRNLAICRALGRLGPFGHVHWSKDGGERHWGGGAVEDLSGPQGQRCFPPAVL